MPRYKVIVDGEIIDTDLSFLQAKKLATTTFNQVETDFFCSNEYAKGGNIMRKNIHARGLVDSEFFVVEIQEI